MKFLGLVCCLLLSVSTAFMLKYPQNSKHVKHFAAEDTESSEIDHEDLTSPEIIRLKSKIDELSASILFTQGSRKAAEIELQQLDEEYGSEIARVKKEFARMKERSIEESTDILNKAKTDALKEVLPITDNYARAKQVFQPIELEGDLKVLAAYEDIFKQFMNVIEDFGVRRVKSVGEPFDFNFMEAIMTAPSTEYKADIVCTEYQIGYKLGEKCIRPAMVVVSTGPGPQ